MHNLSGTARPARSVASAQNIDSARNDFNESFVDRTRPLNIRTTAHSTLNARSRLNSSSISNSLREVVSAVVPPCEIASALGFAQLGDLSELLG